MVTLDLKVKSPEFPSGDLSNILVRYEKQKSPKNGDFKPETAF